MNKKLSTNDMSTIKTYFWSLGVIKGDSLFSSILWNRMSIIFLREVEHLWELDFEASAVILALRRNSSSRLESVIE